MHRVRAGQTFPPCWLVQNVTSRPPLHCLRPPEVASVQAQRDHCCRQRNFVNGNPPQDCPSPFPPLCHVQCGVAIMVRFAWHPSTPFAQRAFGPLEVRLGRRRASVRHRSLWWLEQWHGPPPQGEPVGHAQHPSVHGTIYKSTALRAPPRHQCTSNVLNLAEDGTPSCQWVRKAPPPKKAHVLPPTSVPRASTLLVESSPFPVGTAQSNDIVWL